VPEFLSQSNKSVKKYLGIHLTKVVKELYNENCKILKKEVKQDNR
jgi:hypothetical protein